jgi:hypothetical protein
MRPRWLQGWGVWPQPTEPVAGDPRPWWQKVAVFIGWRGKW